jgi:hypothetical protein
MFRLILPVVIDNEEKRVAELVGATPEKYECEPAIFYTVDNIRPYQNYKNLCLLSSGGDDFIIGLSMEEVDSMIIDASGYIFSAN